MLATTLTSTTLAAILALAGGNDGTKRSPVLQGGMELKIFPVGALVGALRTDQIPPFGRLLFARESLRNDSVDLLALPSKAYSLFSANDKQAPIDHGALLDLLVRRFGQDGWSQGRGSIYIQGSSIIAVAKPATLSAVREYVDNLRRAIAPRLRIEYLLFTTDAHSGPTSVLTAEAAGRLVQQVNSGGQVLYRGIAQARPGELLHLGEVQRLSAQIDMNVEVAQEAKIGDPENIDLELGQGMSVQVAMCPDDSLAVFGLFSDRENTGGIGSIDLAASDLKLVEKLDITQRQVAFSATIAGGGAILLRPGGSSRPELAALVRVERLDEPGQLADTFVATSVLTSPAMTSAQPGLAGIDQAPPMTPDALVETIRNSAGESADGGQVAPLPSGLLLSGPGRGARDLAGYLAAASMRNFVVRITRECKPVAGNGDWKPLGRSLDVPCLGGRIGYVLDGREENYVSDYNVEIAQKAVQGDPVVSAFFDGCHAVVSVEPDGERCRVRIALLDRSLRDLRRIAAASPELGPVASADTSEIAVKRAFDLRIGETAELGHGPNRKVSGMGDCRTRLSLSVHEQR